MAENTKSTALEERKSTLMQGMTHEHAPPSSRKSQVQIDFGDAGDEHKDDWIMEALEKELASDGADFDYDDVGSGIFSVLAISCKFWFYVGISLRTNLRLVRIFA